MRKIVLAALLVLSACGPTAAPEKKEDKDTAPGVGLTAEQVKSLGIATTPARAATYRRQITGYGVVTALDTIAQTDSDFITAAAAAAQSAAAAARARALATGEEAAVSREAVETAQSKAAADQAALALARRKADAAFGLHAPWHNTRERAAIMGRLSSGKTVLVRVNFPIGALGEGTPESLTLTRLGAGGQSWTAHEIWQAPADPTLPGRGFYVLVNGSDLAQNEHVAVSLPTGRAESGAVVPASALLIGDSESWVYVQNGDNHFLRSAIDTGKPLGDGYFVGGGIAPGSRIVTSGAGLLLSREINPSSDAGD